MNISPLSIYLWQLADSLKDSLVPVIILLFIVAAAATLTYVINAMDDEPKLAALARLWMVRVVPLAFAVFIFRTLMPSSNTIAMMVVLPEIAKSKIIQTDLPDIYNAAIDALKKSITPGK